ncbi:hypothetical protein IG631_21302 [Alternaria alternata]|nr:hypothetical protein IG631_21302 [Alternaria alternata]
MIFARGYLYWPLGWDLPLLLRRLPRRDLVGLGRLGLEWCRLGLYVSDTRWIWMMMVYLWSPVREPAPNVGITSLRSLHIFQGMDWHCCWIDCMLEDDLRSIKVVAYRKRSVRRVVKFERLIKVYGTKRPRARQLKVGTESFIRIVRKDHGEEKVVNDSDSRPVTGLYTRAEEDSEVPVLATFNDRQKVAMKKRPIELKQATAHFISAVRDLNATTGSSGKAMDLPRWASIDDNTIDTREFTEAMTT